MCLSDEGNIELQWKTEQQSSRAYFTEATKDDLCLRFKFDGNVNDIISNVDTSLLLTHDIIKIWMEWTIC